MALKKVLRKKNQKTKVKKTWIINIAAFIPYYIQTVRNDQSKANSPTALSNYIFIIDEASSLYCVVKLFNYSAGH